MPTCFNHAYTWLSNYYGLLHPQYGCMSFCFKGPMVGNSWTNTNQLFPIYHALEQEQNSVLIQGNKTTWDRNPYQIRIARI